MFVYKFGGRGGGTVYMRSRGDAIGVASRPIKTTRLTLNERTGDVYLYIRYSQKEWDIEKKRAERRKKSSINQIAIAAGSCHRFVCGNVIMFVCQSESRVHLLCEDCLRLSRCLRLSSRPTSPRRHRHRHRRRHRRPTAWWIFTRAAS